jgi:hypothetical protein
MSPSAWEWRAPSIGGTAIKWLAAKRTEREPKRNGGGADMWNAIRVSLNPMRQPRRRPNHGTARATVANTTGEATWNLRYEVVRSARDKALHIIFVEGKFSEIPDCIRHLGPWQPLSTGDIVNLTPHYRACIGMEGHVLVTHRADSFYPEPNPKPAHNSSARPSSFATGH